MKILAKGSGEGRYGFRFTHYLVERGGKTYLLHDEWHIPSLPHGECYRLQLIEIPDNHVPAVLTAFTTKDWQGLQEIIADPQCLRLGLASNHPWTLEAWWEDQL
jgi:hypothetical protein